MRSAPLLFTLVLAACDPTPAPRPAEPAEADSLPAPHEDTYTETMPDGTRLQGGMHNGERTGIWRSFTPDGKLLSQTEYREGEPHGPSVVFHPNGGVYYTGDNHHGKPLGDWRFQDEQGTLLKIVVYDSTGHKIAGR
ncbi:MAG: hypothetical protein IPI07_02625 [Flavobacteriales bacterium]|nr:hypothetical protein [Flavobacteriales bacterium]